MFCKLPLNGYDSEEIEKGALRNVIYNIKNISVDRREEFDIIVPTISTRQYGLNSSSEIHCPNRCCRQEKLSRTLKILS